LYDCDAFSAEMSENGSNPVPDNNQAVTKADLTNAVKELREYIDERTRDLQTELLRAFADDNRSTGVRFAKLLDLEGHGQ
jgi:hypothetical protein